MACRERGASLRMPRPSSRAGGGGPPPLRRRHGDPAWEPLHEILRHPRWDSSRRCRSAPSGGASASSTPSSPRARWSTTTPWASSTPWPTRPPWPSTTHSCSSSSATTRAGPSGAAGRRAARLDRAAGLLDRDADRGGQLLAARAADDSWDWVRSVAQELEEMTRWCSSTCAPRDQCTRRHPSSRARHRAARAGRVDPPAHGHRDLRVLPPALGDLDDDLAEDVYFVAAEAVHNAVKHAAATTSPSTSRPPRGRSSSSSTTTVAASVLSRLVARRLRSHEHAGAGRALGRLPRGRPGADATAPASRSVCHSCTDPRTIGAHVVEPGTRRADPAGPDRPRRRRP